MFWHMIGRHRQLLLNLKHARTYLDAWCIMHRWWKIWFAEELKLNHNLLFRWSCGINSLIIKIIVISNELTRSNVLDLFSLANRLMVYRYLISFWWSLKWNAMQTPLHDSMHTELSICVCVCTHLNVNRVHVPTFVTPECTCRETKEIFTYWLRLC